MFGYDTVFSSSCPTTFHYVKYKQPVLDIKLSKKHLPSSFVSYYWTCKTHRNIYIKWQHESVFMGEGVTLFVN